MKHLKLAAGVALTSLFALALTHTTTRAQEETRTKPDPAQVARLLAAMGLDTIGEQTIEQTVQRLQSQPGVPPGFLEAFRKEADPKEFNASVAEIYAKELDAGTVDAAITFYESPAGKSLAARLPLIRAATDEARETWLQAVVQRVMGSMGMPDPREELAEARRHGNEAAAIGGLKVIGTAQALFREGDKDEDGNLQYAATLEALGKVGLIDDVLASGEKQGYTFKLCTGSKAPEFLWMAIASPKTPGETGDRHFATSHEGVVYYKEDGPFELDCENAQIEGGLPVGR